MAPLRSHFDAKRASIYTYLPTYSLNSWGAPYLKLGRSQELVKVERKNLEYEALVVVAHELVQHPRWKWVHRTQEGHVGTARGRRCDGDNDSINIVRIKRTSSTASARLAEWPVVSNPSYRTDPILTELTPGIMGENMQNKTV